jgi:hypothetical protein
MKRKGCCLGCGILAVILLGALWAGWRVFATSMARSAVTHGSRKSRVIYVAGPGRLRVVTWRSLRLADGSMHREKISEGVYRLEHPGHAPRSRKAGH